MHHIINESGIMSGIIFKIMRRSLIFYFLIFCKGFKECPYHFIYFIGLVYDYIFLNKKIGIFHQKK